MTDSSPAAPMLRIPSSTLTAVHRVARKGRSPADAATLVREMGYASGEGFLSAFGEWLEHHRQDPGADPAELGADEFWHHLSAFFRSIGWGRLDFEEVHAGIGSLASGDWAEAGTTGSSRQPTCHFTTGMLADLLGRLIDGEMAVMEVGCRSRGDATCRFFIGGSEALQEVFDGMRQGRDALEVVRGLG